MSIEIRPLGTDAEAFSRLEAIDALSFGGDPSEPGTHADEGVMELDRAVLAHDGDKVVGAASLFSLDLSVPGGSVPTAGVTWVGVHPAHRRRGVMRALMRERHDSVHEQGREPLLALWASQGSIYQRFGYGVASHSYQATIPHHLSLAHAPEADLNLELVAASEDAAATMQVDALMRTYRPGVHVGTEAWHARTVHDPPDERAGRSSLRTYVVSDDAGPLAYARFRLKHDWSDGFGNGTVDVNTLVSNDPRATALLYRTVLGTELMRRTQLWNLPVDDPVLTWLDEPREVRLMRRDQLYVRLVDVGDALRRRAYSTECDLVLDVSDEFHPWNTRRWRLSSGPRGAACEPTSDPADLSVDVGVLGATYLGGTTWGALALAGQVDERTPGAMLRAHAAFGWPTAPWDPYVF
ncbi:MAG: GNAT family N-acetyltransferase [Actinomycetes bacterium]